MAITTPAYWDPRLKDSYLTVEKSYIAGNPITGWAYAPGVNVVKYVNTTGGVVRDLTREWLVNNEGFRINRPADWPAPSGPRIWFYGCSITFGVPLGNHEVFTWLLQQRMPETEIRNYGIGGAGTLPMLAHLHKTFEARKQEDYPDIVVYLSLPGHWERNLACCSYLHGMGTGQLFARGIKALKAGLTYPDGELYVSMVDIYDEKLVQLAHPAKYDADPYYGSVVAEAIFAEILKMRDQWGFDFIEAPIMDAPVDRASKFLRARGVPVVPLKFDISDLAQICWPFDSHPNAESHVRFADLLEGPLRETLAKRSSRAQSVTQAAAARPGILGAIRAALSPRGGRH